MEDTGFIETKMSLKYTKFWVMQYGKIETLYAILSALLTMFVCKTNILWYPFAFILFDIVSLLFIGFIDILYRLKWNSCSIDSRLKMANDEYEQIDSEYYTNYSSACYTRSREALTNLREVIDTLKAEKHEQEENKEKELKSNKEIAVYIEEFNNFKKKLNVIRTEDNKDFIKQINQKLKEIIDLVSEKPATTTFANKIYNLYLPEITVLISSIPKDKENRAEFNNNLTDVLNELDTLLDNTKKTILDFSQRNIDISFEVLKKEIKKANEEYSE